MQLEMQNEASNKYSKHRQNDMRQMMSHEVKCLMQKAMLKKCRQFDKHTCTLFCSAITGMSAAAKNANSSYDSGELDKK